MVFYEQPNKDWTLTDFKLLEAYQLLTDEICPQCQNPFWLCRNNSHDIGWSVKEDVCRATKAREEVEWRKDKANRGKNPKREDRESWGKFTYVKPVVPKNRPEGTELPTRESFYGAVNV